MDVSSIPNVIQSAGTADLAKAQGEYAARVFRKSLDIATQGAEQLAQMVGESQGIGRNVNVVG